MKRISFIAIFTLAVLTGCSAQAVSRPEASDYPRVASAAFAQETPTSLKEALAPDVRAHKGKSGFRFLTTGSESLAYRVALIRAAEKSLDLQYYAIHDDVSANLLLEALLEAANRGVRVRFLIDNISMDEVDHSLSILDGVKNIDIRVFNPISTREQGLVSRAVAFVVDFGKAFKRMHNKALVADNQLAILGGRNLGDEYFEEHSDSNFKDTDILAAGPVVARVSESFDRYWNSDDAFPIATLKRPVHDPQEVARLRQELKAHWDKEAQTEAGKKILSSNLASRLKSGEVGLTWAKAELRADAPEKVEQDASVAESKPLDRLESLAASAKREFLLVSPYFVPREDGVHWLNGLVKKGVRVRVLTNSLASTDVVAVHTGYAPYREKLLEGGVELYELKPVGDKRPRQRLFGGSAPAHASLHTKMYIVDGESLLIGSFNLDPRSESLNTEIALVVHSKELGAQAKAMFEEAVAPGSSYKLSLGEDNIVWQAEEKSEKIRFTHEPEAGIRRVQAWITGLLPIEDQL